MNKIFLSLLIFISFANTKIIFAQQSPSTYKQILFEERSTSALVAAIMKMPVGNFSEAFFYVLKTPSEKESLQKFVEQVAGLKITEQDIVSAPLLKTAIDKVFRLVQKSINIAMGENESKTIDRERIQTLVPLEWKLLKARNALSTRPVDMRTSLSVKLSILLQKEGLDVTAIQEYLSALPGSLLKDMLNLKLFVVTDNNNKFSIVSSYLIPNKSDETIETYTFDQALDYVAEETLKMSNGVFTDAVRDQLLLSYYVLNLILLYPEHIPALIFEAERNTIGGKELLELVRETRRELRR